MSDPFARTRRFVDADSAKGWMSLGAFAFLVAGAWIVWLLAGEVALVESARHARLETSAYVHPVESVSAGRVVQWPVALGETVAAGDLLLLLETEHEEHALEESRALLDAWQKRLDASAVALEQLQLMSTQSGVLTTRQIAEIEAKREVELIAHDYAQRRVERSEKLFGMGLLSEVDLLHHQGDAEKASAEARVYGAEAQAREAESLRDAMKHAAELADLERDISEAQGEITALEARIDLLLHEIEDRHLRAPVAGRVGWLAPVRIGAVAEAGDRLAEIVPEGTVRVVGFFPPTAVGRLAVGQRARFRLDALPWTSHGVVDLSVERLATEAEENEVRVELSLQDTPQLPLTHGMTGHLEVTVDRVSPAQWLLQSIGRAANSHSRLAG